MPMNDPNNCGRNQHPVPTPDEICEACKAIQSQWDDGMEEGRRNFVICRRGKKFTPRSGGRDKPYEFPTERG